MNEIKRYQKVIYSVILIISALWTIGILIAPLLANLGGILGSVSEYSYLFYSKSCHQLPSRSYFLGEHAFGVCSRCTAIYFAFLAGVIAYPFIRKLNDIDLPSLKYLGIAVALLLIDVGLDLLDIHKNTFLTRDITGAIIGFILPFYIIPGTVRVFYEFFTPQKITTDSGINNSK